MLHLGDIADFLLAGVTGDALLDAGAGAGLLNRAAGDLPLARVVSHSSVLPGSLGAHAGSAVIALRDEASRAPRERWDLDVVHDPTMAAGTGAVSVPFAAFLSQSAGACDTDILGAGMTEAGADTLPLFSSTYVE